MKQLLNQNWDNICNNWRGEWNKALSDFWCNVKFSSSFTTEFKEIWKENLVIYQKSLKAFLQAPLQLLHNVTTVFKGGNPLGVGKNQNKTEKTVSDIVQMSQYFGVVGHYFINSTEEFQLFMQLVIQGMSQSGDLNNSVLIFNFLDWGINC